MGEWIVNSALLLLVLGSVDAVSRRWSRRRVAFSILLVAVGFALAGAVGVATVPRWLGAGLATGVLLLAVWLLVLRFHLALVPVVAAAMTALDALREGILRAYPGGLAGAIVAAVLTLALAVYWFGRLTEDTAAVEG